MRNALQNFKQKFLGECLEEDPKAFWSYVREVQGKIQTVGSLRDMEGNITCDTKRKANILNEFYQSVFTPDSGKDILPEINTLVSMPGICFTDEGIIKLLRKIKLNKSPGPEGIPARVLKELAESVAPYLKIIFYKSINEGSVPIDWKLANVTPVYKSGSKEDPGNYRPISLTSLSGKVMEHIVVSSLMKYLDSNNFLSKNQHGFRKARSCETQLALFVHDILKSAENKKQVDAIFLDFKKAFDRVPHYKLIYKLKLAGIDREVIDWVKDFLCGREQQVVLDGVSSNKVKVTSGVPQGSVIGPLLFLIYINDLSDEINSNVRIFADDSVIYSEIANAEDRNTLSNDLALIQRWCDKWQLELNVSKCSVVNFFERNQFCQNCPYKINGINLNVVESVEYLGITLTNNLNWSTHVRKICGKATKKLGFIKRIVGRCDEKVRERCYFTLVRPHLEYAASIWDPADETYTRELEKVQRKAIRFVKKCYDKKASVTKMLSEAGWESLKERRLEARLRLLNKFREGTFAEDVIDIMRPPCYISRSDNERKIREIDARTSRFRDSFFPRTIRDNNKLKK